MRPFVPIVKKQCYFCTANAKIVDYKDTETLRSFMTPQAKIVSKKRSGLCSLHQRRLATAIKRARVMGIVAFTIR
ncbi:MAG: 30S ribosomal protein S18 [Patescibacteria group bacterium]|jgi:small subunit ribosomal protein S18